MSPRPRLDHVRRPAMLSAAAEVIRERGLENARVSDVAERAGTSAPSVLYYFETKAELLKEALTSAEEEYYDDLERELDGIESARERLARIVAGGAGDGDYDASLWMELWARALRDPDLAATRAELDGRWRQADHGRGPVRPGTRRVRGGGGGGLRDAARVAARRARRADRAEGRGGHARSAPAS